MSEALINPALAGSDVPLRHWIYDAGRAVAPAWRSVTGVLPTGVAMKLRACLGRWLSRATAVFSTGIRWFRQSTTDPPPKENVGQPRYSAFVPPRIGTVFVLRCTQKLLDRLNSIPDPDPASSDTALGDWYANLIRVGRIQVVLAVSERSLLPVVVSARDGRALVQRLCEALGQVLTAIGVPADDAIAERGAMRHWALGKTANRRVLGSLNDLAFQLQVGLLDFPDRTLLAQSLWLAKTPLKVIDYGAPDQATLAAFATHRALRAVIGP